MCIKKLNEGFKYVCRDVPKLMTRRFQSSVHASSWKKYEDILMVRSQVATFSKILISSILWLVGCETWNLSEEYLDKEGGPVNAELAR